MNCVCSRLELIPEKPQLWLRIPPELRLDAETLGIQAESAVCRQVSADRGGENRRNGVADLPRLLQSRRSDRPYKPIADIGRLEVMLDVLNA